MNRHFIFRHYWWIALLAGGTLALLVFCFGEDEKVGLVGACIAGTLGFCYFAQQQNEEVKTESFYGLTEEVIRDGAV